MDENYPGDSLRCNQFCTKTKDNYLVRLMTD